MRKKMKTGKLESKKVKIYTCSECDAQLEVDKRLLGKD
ncbi:MAG: hypothetical protein UX22_C0030G0008 [Candidatus Jorgensenbacteria bacterium GW2011_GWA2_45_9]|uniref:Uncharacterized protein n=1 Tax=Candidatus Jorgensenbacteria bacterium GW2011_GWA2_45_9 TaxID=1618663 RepID=A0A0G1R036_9BACT|nr:MAG: hypothetical protein UX22_C0030G0008 [Candidatus Jorgensenbacteria bacterium GW2011_GWA2_45_9]